VRQAAHVGAPQGWHPGSRKGRSAIWINLVLCGNWYGSVFGCRQSARVKVLGKDRPWSRLETQAFGKVRTRQPTSSNT